MLVYDVIKNCDIAHAACIWLDVWADEEERRQWSDSAARVILFWEMLCGLAPSLSGYVMIAFNCCEYGKRYTTTKMFQKADLMESLDTIRGREMPAYSEETPVDVLREIGYEVSRWFPRSYDFESRPWEDVLGVEMYADNVERTGMDAIAAYLLYEMSFDGYTREVHDARRKYLGELWENFENSFYKNGGEDGCAGQGDPFLGAVPEDDEDDDDDEDEEWEQEEPEEDGSGKEKEWELEELENKREELSEFQRILEDLASHGGLPV